LGQVVDLEAGYHFETEASFDMPARAPAVQAHFDGQIHVGLSPGRRPPVTEATVKIASTEAA
jgi:hypothetical protein